MREIREHWLYDPLGHCRKPLHRLDNVVSEDDRTSITVQDEDEMSRSLNEAKAYYRDRKARLTGWTPEEFEYLRNTLDAEYMTRLGYSFDDEDDQAWGTFQRRAEL